MRLWSRHCDELVGGFFRFIYQEEDEIYRVMFAADMQFPGWKDVSSSYSLAIMVYIYHTLLEHFMQPVLFAVLVILGTYLFLDSSSNRIMIR